MARAHGLVADHAIDAAAQVRAPSREGLDAAVAIPMDDGGLDDREADRNIGRDRDVGGDLASLLAPQHRHQRRDEGKADRDGQDPPEEPTPGRELRDALGHEVLQQRAGPIADRPGFYSLRRRRDETGSGA
jgi:hypothetical protein